jgi:hypothetical protein
MPITLATWEADASQGKESRSLGQIVQETTSPKQPEQGWRSGSSNKRACLVTMRP